MKKYTTFLVLLTIVFGSFAQNIPSNTILVRHDTTLLKAAECEWLIKSLAKNDPALTSEIGKSVPFVILQAIEKGTLIAFDRETNKPIPSKEIYTWKIFADTVVADDADGNIKYNVVQRKHRSDNFPLIRIYQDWYFDVSTGKFQSVIKFIDLLEEIHTNATGYFIGYMPFCRIYY